MDCDSFADLYYGNGCICLASQSDGDEHGETLHFIILLYNSFPFMDSTSQERKSSSGS